MTDLQLEIPEDVEHRLNDALRPGGDLVGREEEQVDIRKWRHFAPSITADPDQRDLFARRRVGNRMQMGLRHVESRGDKTIGQVGIGSGEGARLERAGLKGGGDGGATTVIRPPQDAHDLIAEFSRFKTIARNLVDAGNDAVPVEYVRRVADQRPGVEGSRICDLRGARGQRLRNLPGLGQLQQPVCSESSRPQGRAGSYHQAIV